MRDQGRSSGRKGEGRRRMKGGREERCECEREESKEEGMREIGECAITRKNDD